MILKTSRKDLLVDAVQPVELTHPFLSGMMGLWTGIPGASSGPRFSNLLRPGDENGIHGTLTSGATWSSGPNGAGAITVTGGSSISIPDFTNLAAADFTVRIIHKPTTWPADYTVICDKGASREMSFFFSTAGNLNYVGIGTTSGPANITMDMTPGFWWDFVATRLSDTVYYYVNGVFKGSQFSTGVGENSDPWLIGNNASGGGTHFDGLFAHVEYLSKGISQETVTAKYLEFIQNHPNLLRWVSTRTIFLPPTSGPPGLNQEGFIFRNDDGSETTATSNGTQDSNVTAISNTNLRLRTIIDSVTDIADKNFRIEYREKNQDSLWKIMEVK